MFSTLAKYVKFMHVENRKSWRLAATVENELGLCEILIMLKRGSLMNNNMRMIKTAIGVRRV